MKTAHIRMKTLALMLSILIASPVYAGITGWSTSNHLRRQSQVVSGATPLFISVWVNAVDTSVTQATAAAGLDGASGSTHYQRSSLNNLELCGAATGGAASQVAANSAASVTTGTWQHCSAAFVSSTNRRAYVNGGDVGTSAVDLTPDAADSFYVGIMPNGSTSPTNSSGGIAEVSVWTCCGTNTNAANLAAKLAAGENPININAESAQPWTGTLVAYWPLTSNTDLTDAAGNGHTLSTVGTLSNHASHPTIDPVAGGASRARSQTIFVD